MKPHHSPCTKTGTVMNDWISCAAKSSRAGAVRSLTLAAKISFRADRLCEVGEADLVEAHVLHDVVLELRRDAGRHPLEPLRARQTAVRADAGLEQVGPAGVGRPAELAEQHRCGSAPVRLGHEALGGVADRLENRVSAAQIALGLQALFARARVGEDDASWPATSTRSDTSCSPQMTRLGAVEPEDALELAVAEERHVHERGDASFDQPVPDRIEPGCRAHVLEDDRRSGFETLDIVSAPLDFVPELGLPDIGRVTDVEAALFSTLDVADMDVPEEVSQPPGGVGDDLVGRRLVSGEREDADQQLEAHLVLLVCGDVLEKALRGAVDHDLVVPHPDDTAVACDQAVIGLGRRGALAVARRDVAEHVLPVVGVDAADEEVRVVQPLGRRVAQQALDLRADVQRRALLVELVDVDHERQVLHDRAEIETGHVLLVIGHTSGEM